MCNETALFTYKVITPASATEIFGFAHANSSAVKMNPLIPIIHPAINIRDKNSLVFKGLVTRLQNEL